MVDHLERGLSGSSVRFPIGRNKDGSLSKASRVLTPRRVPYNAGIYEDYGVGTEGKNV